MQPLTVHLRQEIDRLNIIVRLATTTLQNLRLAIAGTIALSGALIESLDALFMARIPAAWLKNSWEVRAHMKGTLSSRHTSCRKIPWQLAQQCSLQHTSTVPLHHCVVVCAAFAWGTASMLANMKLRHTHICCAVCPAGLHSGQLVHRLAAAARPAGQVAHTWAPQGLLANRLLQPPGTLRWLLKDAGCADITM
jgi:hypothetical protein